MYLISSIEYKYVLRSLVLTYFFYRCFFHRLGNDSYVRYNVGQRLFLTAAKYKTTTNIFNIFRFPLTNSK